jgi:hypothetical protein
MAEGRWCGKLRKESKSWYANQYQVPSAVETTLSNIQQGKVSPIRMPKPASADEWKQLLNHMPSSKHVKPERLEDWSNTLAGTGFKNKERTYQALPKATYSDAGRKVGGNKRVDISTLAREKKHRNDSEPTPRSVSYKHSLMHATVHANRPTQTGAPQKSAVEVNWPLALRRPFSEPTAPNSSKTFKKEIGAPKPRLGATSTTRIAPARPTLLKLW